MPSFLSDTLSLPLNVRTNFYATLLFQPNKPKQTEFFVRSFRVKGHKMGKGNMREREREREREEYSKLGYAFGLMR